MFTGCGSNSPTSSSDKIGYLIDSAVQGVEYQCGDKIDITAIDGKFICPELPVSFYIGSLKLGSISVIPTDLKVFPQDIIGISRSNLTDARVIRLAMLLQSLDNDNNASNGITITPDVRNRFNEESEITVEEIQQLHPTLQLVTEENAIEHLTSTITTTNNNNTTTLKLPEGYNYRMINNQGIPVESKLDNYTIQLYSNTNETVSPQSRHSGIVVKINEKVSENIAIQATYLGKSMVVAVYNEKNELTAISDIIQIIDVSVIVVTLSI